MRCSQCGSVLRGFDACNGTTACSDCYRENVRKEQVNRLKLEAAAAPTSHYSVSTWQEGANACRAGIQRSYNPYYARSNDAQIAKWSEAWDNGWAFARHMIALENRALSSDREWTDL